MDKDDHHKVQEVLHEGSSFGLKSLLYNIPMESSARAITHVDMFTFSQADFELVLRDHGNMEEMISQVAVGLFGEPLNLARHK